MIRACTTTALSLAAFAVLVLSAEAATIEVTVAKMAFSPATITAKPGDTITWTNKDFVAHSATARDKSFDVIIPANGTGSLTVSAAGTFDYFCKFHPMMKGSVTVGE